MSVVLKSLPTLALVVGALAIAVLSVGAGAGRDTAPVDESLVPVMEGGRLGAGYLDGRPVPSGFALPVVIRWMPKSEAERVETGSSQAELAVARPIEGSVVTP